ncbi:MAG: FeoA family protein [Anaerovorax sp.]
MNKKPNTLDKLRTGEKAKIKAVGGSGQLRRSLLDMGLTPNTTVMIRKVAPLGDPMEICLRGYELTLRKIDAREIEVEVIADECNNCNQCGTCGKS